MGLETSLQSHLLLDPTGSALVSGVNHTSVCGRFGADPESGSKCPETCLKRKGPQTDLIVAERDQIAKSPDVQPEMLVPTRTLLGESNGDPVSELITQKTDGTFSNRSIVPK